MITLVSSLLGLGPTLVHRTVFIHVVIEWRLRKPYELTQMLFSTQLKDLNLALKAGQTSLAKKFQECFFLSSSDKLKGFFKDISLEKSLFAHA